MANGKTSPTLERWRGEVTQSLKDIMRRLDELGERFDDALNRHVESDNATFRDHDSRIAEVERKQASLWGRATVVAAVGAAIGAALIDGMMRKLTGG